MRSAQRIDESGIFDAGMSPARITLAVLLILAGVVSFGVFLGTSIVGILGELQRVDTPGRRELLLEPGEYTLFWETDSRFQRAAGLDELDLTVVPKESGAGLNVAASGLWTTHYSTMDRFGLSIATFDVGVKETYVVKVAAASGKALPRGGIAVRKAFGFFAILKIVAGCIVLLGGGVGSGVAVLLRRRPPDARGA
jgi:hypothetical protein